MTNLSCLVQIETPRVEDIECLCKLMSTVGSQLENSQRYVKAHMDAYFDRMDKMTKLPHLEVSILTVLSQHKDHVYRIRSRTRCLSNSKQALLKYVLP